jgi:hypothetical protein
MAEHSAGPRWAPRVAVRKIRQLYESDARGIRDEELLDEVAFALYARCESVLTVTEAARGRLRCPRCARLCERINSPTGKSRDHVFRCEGCAWETTWGTYRGSFEDRHLIGRGAVDAFQAYVDGFSQARSPQERMLLVDGLIHAIHKELADSPQWPAAINLVEGNVLAVTRLLEELAYGPGSTPGLAEVKARWHAIQERQAAGKKPGS